MWLSPQILLPRLLDPCIAAALVNRCRISKNLNEQKIRRGPTDQQEFQIHVFRKQFLAASATVNLYIACHKPYKGFDKVVRMLDRSDKVGLV